MPEPTDHPTRFSGPATPAAPAMQFAPYPSATDGFAPAAVSDAPASRKGLVLALSIAALFVCLLGLGALALVWNGKENHAPGTITTDAAGLHYLNPKLGIDLTAPKGWEQQPPQESLALLQKGDCVVSLVDNTLLFGTAQFQGGLQKGILANHPDAVFGPAAPWHGAGAPRAGLTVEVPGDSSLHENWFSFQHGTHLTTLIEVQPPEDTGCPAAFAALEHGLSLH